MKTKIKLSKWAEMNDYTYRGAYNLYKNGSLKTSKTKTGSILVEVDDDGVDESEYTVVYARVSSSENKKNLDTQAERVSNFCYAKGWVVNEVVKECASGLNDSRPKLLKIFTDKKATRIVVEHKDRLTRFGFEYIKTLFPGEIIVINETENSDSDLMQDFVSLVTSFCARIYGFRRSKRKTEQIINSLKNND